MPTASMEDNLPLDSFAKESQRWAQTQAQEQT